MHLEDLLAWLLKVLSNLVPWHSHTDVNSDHAGGLNLLVALEMSMQLSGTGGIRLLEALEDWTVRTVRIYKVSQNVYKFVKALKEISERQKRQKLR